MNYFAPKLLLVVLFLLPLISSAQSLSIKRAKGIIKIDGVLDEPDWLEAETANAFRQYFPMDTSLAKAQTKVRMIYDDQFIYISAVMENEGPRKYVTPSLRRDFRGEANDGFTVVFDTFLDRTNAFAFGINPFGVQREGLISNGGGVSSVDFTLNWDNKWWGEAKTYEGYWTAEMAIPFKTLRFKENLDTWYVNFYRIDSEYAERSTWSPIPRNFDIVNLAFSRELRWDEPLHKPGPNISLIPYTAINSSKNFEERKPAQTELQAGGDAKIGLGPALNLDLTVNPDFSQVEVDQQVTNLDRFEIFFPERRQFFLENADLFANSGVENTRPFFSRRIGVARDTSTGQNIQNPIYAGARLSGKINNNTRIGFLTMQAGELKSIELPSTNYTVATIQRKIWTRSNWSIIAMNKQAFQDSVGTEFTASPANYNRLIGVDLNLATHDNKWSGKAFYHHSFDQNKLDSSFAMGGVITYSTYRWQSEVFTRNVGANYNPEMGFVKRRDILQLASTTYYNFYPSKGPIQRHGPGFDFDMVGNDRYGFLDWDINFMYRIRWRSTAQFSMRLRQQYTYLFNPFDPTGTNGLKLPAFTSYTNNLFVGEYVSDARKKMFFQVNTRSGEYFNGYRMNLEGVLTYRYQPWGFVSMNFAYNGIRLPNPYKDVNLILLGPRIDLTFSRSVFWTTFLQYNSQINNMNINSRFQWRFKPVSDFFVVYTDNYFAEGFENGRLFHLGHPKIRALVFKLTYWINL